VVFLRWVWPVAFQRPVNAPLVEFRVPPESYPTDPSQPTVVRQLLSWAFGPFSTCQNRRSTCRELAGLTPLRLQGLVTLLTAYSLRNLVGFVSHRQHSWASPFGVFSPARYSTRFHIESTHLPFHLPLFPNAEAPDRPDRPRFLGLDPARRPDRTPMGLASAPPENSLGVLPFRACCEDLDQDFARSPLTRFADRTTNDPIDRRLRVSIDLRFACPSLPASRKSQDGQPS
jgi:hypothetical protein